jgi:hypothetical protein
VFLKCRIEYYLANGKARRPNSWHSSIIYAGGPMNLNATMEELSNAPTFNSKYRGFYVAIPWSQVIELRFSGRQVCCQP